MFTDGFIFSLQRFANIYNETSNTVVSGTSGNDSIDNWSAYVTISAGAGNDSICNTNNGYISISGGAGDDMVSLETSSATLTINGGSGNDSVYWDGSNNPAILHQYAKGDGFDIINGFTENDTLTISGGSYSTTESGYDVVVKVDKGKVTLKNVYASTNTININNKSIALKSKNIKLTSDNKNINIFRDSISVSGSEDGDIIKSSGENVTISGGAGNDSIKVSGVGCQVSGGAGNDSIDNWNNNNVTIDGGKGNDSIDNYYSDFVSINAGAGDDSVYNYGSNNTITGGKGDDTINNRNYKSEYSSNGENNFFKYTAGDGNDIITGFNATSTLSISGGSYSTQASGYDVLVKVGKETITLKNVYATSDKININGKKTSLKRKNIKLTSDINEIDIFRDSISVAGSEYYDEINNYGYYVTISGGAGNDEINNYGSNVSISESTGDDYIYNSGSNVTINSGAGDDYIRNYGSNVSISGGDDADTIDNNANNVTIAGGAGDDSISLYISSYSDTDYAENTIIKYKAGDGNDIIEGFNENDTLSISGGSYSTTKSDEDIIVTVGKGKITLQGAAKLEKVNIKASKSSTSSNTWKLSGTTATYGTSSKTLVTVKGVKSTDGLSVSGKVVTVAASSLNKTKVTVSNGYTLKLASDVTKTSTKKAWSLSNSTATYNQTTTAGYKLASDDKSISYTKKATKTLATVNGAKSKSGLKLDGNTIKLAASSLSKKVSVSGSYAFEFSSDYKNAKITGSSSADTIKTSGANMTITGGKGNDSLTGGKGADVFVYSNGDGNDVITNFDESDIISLKSGAAEISTSGNDVVFTIGKGKITLKKANGKNITYFDADGNENIYPETKGDVEYNKNGIAATLNVTYAEDNFEPSNYGTYQNTLLTIDASAVKHSLKITGNKNANKITGTDEDDSIYGGKAGDTLLGGKGNDELYGEAGNDSLIGGAGDDSLWGDEGSDTLSGGEGDDSLWGGKANDTLIGGEGADVFIYNTGDGNDVIYDFNSSVDKIRVLSGQVEAPVADSSGDVTFTVGTGQIVVKNGAKLHIPIYDGYENILQRYSRR